MVFPSISLIIRSIKLTETPCCRPFDTLALVLLTEVSDCCIMSALDCNQLLQVKVRRRMLHGERKNVYGGKKGKNFRFTEHKCIRSVRARGLINKPAKQGRRKLVGNNLVLFQPSSTTKITWPEHAWCVFPVSCHRFEWHWQILFTLADVGRLAGAF